LPASTSRRARLVRSLVAAWGIHSDRRPRGTAQCEGRHPSGQRSGPPKTHHPVL